MKLEEARIGYASIAVLDFKQSGKIAVETISVTRDACDLSGAWLLENDNSKDFNTITYNKLLVVLNFPNESKKDFSISNSRIVTAQEFIQEAIQEVHSAIKLFQTFKDSNEKEYAEYMSVAPAERKKLPKVVKKSLVEPDFSTWPLEVNLMKAEQELEKLGKLGSIEGSVEDMRHVLSASRLIQLFINMWKNDETERLNRQYVTGDDATSTILPIAWLKKLK